MSKRAETGFNREESTLDQLRRGSSSIYADHRYCLELSTSSIASFEPGSIVLRYPSVFVVPSGSRVVHLRLTTGIPALFISLRHVAGIPALSGFPALFVSLRYVPGIPAFSGFPALSVDLRRVAGIPALSSIGGHLSFPRFLRSARSNLDLPRLQSLASFTLELYYYRALQASLD